MMRNYRGAEGEEGAKCRERGDASATKAKMLQGRGKAREHDVVKEGHFEAYHGLQVSLSCKIFPVGSANAGERVEQGRVGLVV
jgi:hypothetical protein